MPRIAALRDRVWSGVEARFGAGVVLNGHPDLRLPSTLNCSFIGASGGEILGGLAGVAATAVNDRVALFALAPSLGEVESLVTQPCTTTHHCLTREERARRGISDAMLGLSIGLEDAEDLIADLHQALG